MDFVLQDKQNTLSRNIEKYKSSKKKLVRNSQQASYFYLFLSLLQINIFQNKAHIFYIYNYMTLLIEELFSSLISSGALIIGNIN
jgi:hypothetical protein